MYLNVVLLVVPVQSPRSVLKPQRASCMSAGFAGSAFAGAAQNKPTQERPMTNSKRRALVVMILSLSSVRTVV